jgi:two-component system, LuxR family, sensor histidine kinase DctS
VWLQDRDEAVAGASGRRRREALFAAMPVVAILLLVALIGLLLWLTARGEREATQTQLIGDALWVEQALRFQLSTDEDVIAGLALDSGRADAGTGTFLDRGRLLLANNPEVVALARLDADGRMWASLPSVAGGAIPPEVRQIGKLSGYSVRPVYGSLRRMPDGGLVIDLAAPAPVAGGAGGTVVATISLSTLITRHVPWWIAEKYAVRLVDTAGATLAEKARVEPLDKSLVHLISFDPPISGTLLSIAPYHPTGPARPNLLFAAILGLAVFAVVSLVVLQRHGARRRRIEERLSTEMAFRRAMEASLTVGMRARDAEGRIIYVNPAFCRMVGYSAEELIGVGPPMPYWLPDQIPETKARHDALIQGERKPHSYETRFRRRDGSLLDALLYEAPLMDADGVHRGWMGSIIDVTERKAAGELARRQAEKLQHTSRLISLGEMASTLAHELNQPLASIASYATGSLNLLRGESADLGAVREAIGKLALQAERAGRIIRRIQDFARKREPRFRRIAIATLIEETIGLAAVDARNLGMRIEATVAPHLPPVTADRTLLEQVLLNLLRNAMEAMTGAAERVLSLSAELAGAEVVIAVADRGPGIDESVEGRIFDAFVSTKAEGMGMGLNICRSIVELHHGRLTHTPRPGGGTIFTVVLPAAGESEAREFGGWAA